MIATDRADTAAETSSPSFATMGLTSEVLRALDEIGYEKPTPVQHAAYAKAVAGQDIIVQARTGTGKTAAFGIPLVDRIVNADDGVQALVLAPTRELALQSAREMERLGKYRETRTVAVYGGAPMQPQIKELEGGAQIVSGTPGRVLDHLRRGTFDASNLRVLVLDEMDEMLSMGFAKELNAILELIPGSDKRQTMCFSATVDGAIRRHAERHMKDPELVSLSSDAVGAEQITHYVYMVSGSSRSGDLIQVLNAEDPETAIIFCNMRSETERVAADLQKAGFNADWLNGDLPQKDRERTLAATREGRLRYLVATDVAARGIDISHVTHVINYSFPESAATYVHRTGRTGRAGRTGHAISLVSPQELGRLYYLRLEYKITPIERSLPNSGEQKTQQELDRLKLLESSMERQPTADDRALARRLLSHPEAERILGGLLRAFFGHEDEEAIDEKAAQARRDKAPTRVEDPRRESRRRRADGRSRDRRRDEEDSEDSGEPRRERSRRSRRPRGEEEREAQATGDQDGAEGQAASSVDEPRHEDGEKRRRRRRRRSRDEEQETTAASSGDAGEEKPSSEAAERPAKRARREEHPDDKHESQLADGRPVATVFLKVGRRDGARPGAVARFMEESAKLDPSDVGKIRTRDRYTYVEVPEEYIDDVLENLQDANFGDRSVDAERARVKTS